MVLTGVPPPYGLPPPPSPPLRAQVRWNFLRSQTIEQLASEEEVGDASDYATLAFGELQECVARCALDKYKPIKQMSEAVMVTSFCKNLLGEENTEECMNTATLIKAERYNWKRYSQTLPGPAPADHGVPEGSSSTHVQYQQ